jgi:adenylate cyclase
VSESRKLAAILAADVVGYSRLAGADEDRILARLRALRSDLIDPTIAVHNGRIVKRTGDGSIVEFRSVVDAVKCAIEIQNAMVERNAGVSEAKRIEFRVGIHIGDVVEESDGDLMGDGVNIAARLEGIAKAGAICLSEQAYWQVKSRLDLAVADLGPIELKNIAEPIRVYSLQIGLAAQAKPATDAKPRKSAPTPRSTLALLGAGIVSLLVIAGFAWYFLGAKQPATVLSSAPTRPEPAHLSIVVLPFANLSGDPAQDYFADGVTENLTTELSRIRGSFVIARNTAFTFKGKSVDAKDIGRELGVRYVLEGSAQRDRNRVRVNVQLVDAGSGAHLWADRFEEDTSDLFKLQDEVVARLANALRYELVKAEADRNAGSKNPDVIDLNMRGAALRYPPFTKDKIGAARAFFEQALKIDPENSDALTGDAWTYHLEASFLGANPETDYEAKVLGQADRAIAIAPDDVWAYDLKAAYLTHSSHPVDGLRAADAALAIDPNFAPAYATRAWTYTVLRQFEQAKSDVQQAMRLSPRDPALSIWHNLIAEAELGLGDYDAAIDEVSKAIATGYPNWYSFLDMAAAHALKGEIEEAKAPLAEARRLYPKLSAKWIREQRPTQQSAIDGLRKAGLPEE